MRNFKKFLKKKLDKKTYNKLLILYHTFKSSYDNPLIEFLRKIINLFRPKYPTLFFFHYLKVPQKVYVMSLWMF